MAVKVLRVFQEFTSAGYVPMPIAGNIDYGVTVANTFPATTPATFQTDDPDIEVNVTEVTDFYVWIRSHGTAWNYLYTRNVRVYPDSPTINNVVMGIIIARLTDAVPYTGATQDTDLGEFGLKAGWLGLDLTPTNTPTDVGTISWDDQDGTANLVLKGGNVNLQIGQEQVTRVVNKTGASLLEANYQAVRISGAQGNRLKVSLAQANNDANSADTIGLVTETIANNQEGFVTTSGLVKGINTTGSLQSETWVDGDVLYLSGTTAGMITNVKPQAPTHTVIIGYVVRAHATQGQIYVKVDNGYELDELHNVRITTPADKDFLIYDGTNQYWKNRDLFGTTGYLPVYDTTSLLKDSIIYTDGTAIGIGTNVLQSGAVATFGDVAHFTENISLADSKGIVSGGVNMLSRNNLNNQIIIGADGGINDNVAFYAGDLERMRLLANGRLAINKTTASYQVDVQGDVNVSGAFRVNGTIIPNGTVTSVAMSVPTGLVISGSPITSSGTLAVTYAVNYGIPTLTKQIDWDDAYTWVTNFPDQLGNSGKFLTTNGSVLSWASLVTGVSSVFGRTGAVTAQSGDYTTAQVTESGNLYYTDARARLALSGGTGITYNNTTGVIAYSGTVYTDSSIRALFSAGAGISYNNTTGVITSTITQYTDAMARASLSFVAGSGAYNSTTGVITIPTNTNQLTNGASFITLASLSASAPLSYNNGTGAFSISQASGSTNGFLSSTDWNTFNNKQNALTNPVTGTGTTNYLPKFTGNTTLGNSLIYDNGTNVTLENNQNGSTWFIVKNTNVGSGAASGLLMTNNTGDLGAISLLSSGNSPSNALFIRTLSTNPLILGTGNAEYMRITSTGNVSIGNTNNTYKLDVSGTGRFIGTGTTSALTITNSTSNPQNYIDFTADATVISRLARGNGASGMEVNGLNIDNYSGFKVRLNQLGGSGGTFSVDGGAATFSSSVTATSFSVSNGSLSNNGFWGTLITVGSGSGYDFGIVRSNTNAIAGVPTGTGNFYFANNVGIGTTSPLGKLHVVGGDNSELFRLDGSGNTRFAYKITSGVNDVLTLYRNHVSVGNLDIISFGFNGNVGIGTTSPSQKLEVVGNINATNTSADSRVLATASGVANTVLGFNNSGSTSGGMSNNVGYVNILQAYPLVFGTDSTERMRITSQGRLLLGTTSSGSLMFEFSDGANTNKYTTLAGNLRAVGRITDDLTNVRGIGFGYSSAENLGFIYGTSNGTNTSKLAFLIFNGSTWQTNMTLKTGGTTLNIGGIPSSNAGLVSGDVYKDANGFLKIV